MENATIHSNAIALWNYPKNALIAKGDTLKTVGPIWWPLIGRLIFRFKDWISKGEESKKVQATVIQTFQAMELQMANKEKPHWHFTQLFMTPKGPVTVNYTYEMLAERVLQKSPLSKNSQVKQETERVKDQFNQIDFTQNVKGVTKEDAIYYVISGPMLIVQKEQYGASIIKEELEFIVNEKKQGLFQANEQTNKQITQRRVNSE